MKYSNLDLSRPPLYMAIVNVTPDSSSDGGKYYSDDYNPSNAVDAALRLEDQGAGIIDIGGESTRPAAVSVSLDEELRRIEPVLEQLDGRLEIPISIDTYKFQVAISALDRGAKIVNDVTGGTDVAMREVWAKYQPAVVIMHHLPGMFGASVPPQHGQKSFYKDVIEEVYQELENRLNSAVKAGLPKKNIALDVGIGFGKTPQDNWALLDNIREFHNLGCPLVVGVSRKRFLNFSDEKTAEVGKKMVDSGVQILRVHKIPEEK